MKRIVVAVVCAGLCVSAAGCQSSPNRAGEGAVIGGLIGAGAGAIIGHQSGERDKGALIGGLAGALAGVLTGSQVQKDPAQQVAASQPQQAVQPQQPARAANPIARFVRCRNNCSSALSSNCRVVSGMIHAIVCPSTSTATACLIFSSGTLSPTGIPKVGRRALKSVSTSP